MTFDLGKLLMKCEAGGELSAWAAGVDFGLEKSHEFEVLSMNGAL